MNSQQQRAFIAEVYQKVYKDQVSGTDAEIEAAIETKKKKYFAPDYEQWSNYTYYNFSIYSCHLEEVNARSEANFALKFLSQTINELGLNEVTSRAVITDAATGDFLSGVISCWTFSDDRKMISCRETLFDPPTDDSQPDCGENQDPTKWGADVRI